MDKLLWILDIVRIQKTQCCLTRIDRVFGLQSPTCFFLLLLQCSFAFLQPAHMQVYSSFSAPEKGQFLQKPAKTEIQRNHQVSLPLRSRAYGFEKPGKGSWQKLVQRVTYGGFRFVMGIPPVIIHIERWNFSCPKTIQQFFRPRTSANSFSRFFASSAACGSPMTGSFQLIMGVPQELDGFCGKSQSKNGWIYSICVTLCGGYRPYNNPSKPSSNHHLFCISRSMFGSSTPIYHKIS